jgi:hypothetical protein
MNNGANVQRHASTSKSRLSASYESDYYSTVPPPQRPLPHAVSVPSNLSTTRPPSFADYVDVPRRGEVPRLGRKDSAGGGYASQNIAGTGTYYGRQDRRRSNNNYPGVSYADVPHMQRRKSSSGPYPPDRPQYGRDAFSAPSRTTVYDAYPNMVKFKRKGTNQSGITLQDAMMGVRLSGRDKYLMRDLHLDANAHLSLKISVSYIPYSPSGMC